jgi:two-component system sporulation sensor kinase C
MNRKKSNLFSTSRAIIEFAIAIILAVIVFESVNSLGFFEKFYQATSPRHSQYDRALLTIAFLAAAMMVFCFRRWFELRRAHKELTKHKKYLEALDKAAGILLLSISEIKYEEFLNALGPASGADRVHMFLKVTDDNLNTPFRREMQWHRNEKFSPVPTELVQKRFFEEIFPGWHKTLINGRYISLGTKNFPPEQLDHWNSLQIKALLVVPVLIDNQLKGFISFDNCTDSRPWTESEIEFLDTAAKDLAITLKRLDYKKELTQERDFAQRLIETAQTIVLVMDANGNIVTFNPYFEKLSGYKLQEVKGKNWFNIFLPFEYKQKISRVFQEAVNNIHIDANINPILTKDGRLRQIEWYGRTLKDYNGRVIGVLSTGQDITERLKASEQLKKAHSELEQRVAQRTAELQNTNATLMKTMEERDHIQRILQETEKLAAVGKMSAQIAHEINNPMAGIKNSFLLVKEAIPVNHRYFEYVGRIEKEIDRVSQIVRQMFDLYRPDTASADKFKLYDTIKDIVELLKIARQEKNINIEIECDPNTIVTLSEVLLRQVIYNIAQNAIQACGQEATVKISASLGDDRLNLSVSDQGPGIDEAIKDKIFEPFFTTGMGGAKGGLGLGLAITKDIINAMDGTIDFISEKNKGTTFNISIPLPDEKTK